MGKCKFKEGDLVVRNSRVNNWEGNTLSLAYIVRYSGAHYKIIQFNSAYDYLFKSNLLRSHVLTIASLDDVAIATKRYNLYNRTGNAHRDRLRNSLNTKYLKGILVELDYMLMHEPYVVSTILKDEALGGYQIPTYEDLSQYDWTENFNHRNEVRRRV